MTHSSSVTRTEGWVYVAVDGDDVGRRVEKLITSGSEEAVRSFSAAVVARLGLLAEMVPQSGGRLVFCAGDSWLAWVPRDTGLALCARAVSPHEVVEFSGGIGPGMTEATLALSAAKARGRCCYVTWEDLLEQY